jgi:DNA-binding transcriptional LysR family regulator
MSISRRTGNTGLELRHWLAFAEAAETQHFGLAAERLGISQPALSQLIKTVETSFGATLFDRSRRRVSLTEAGRMLLPEARAVVSHARRAEQVGLAAGRGSKLALSMGYVGSAALHPLFLKLVSTLTQARTGISLRLDQSSVTDQVRQIADRQLDVGVIRSPMPAIDSAIGTVTLASESLVLAVPAASMAGTGNEPVALADFSTQMFVQYRPQLDGGLHLLVNSACAAAGFAPRVAQAVPQIATMLCLVGAGLGVALVPESAAGLSLRGVTYLRLRRPVPTELNLLYRRSDTAPAVREAVRTARSLDKRSL